MNREQSEAVNAIFDDAIKEHADLPTATRHALAELEDLEGGGHPWVRDYIDSATRAGLASRVRTRAKSQRVVVNGVPMPGTYSTSSGLRSWLDLPVAELDEIIKPMEGQSDVMALRAGVMRLAQALARKYGVATAAEAFEIEAAA